MTTSPLDEILRTERSIRDQISKVTEEAATEVAAARRQGKQLVEEARARGRETAERRYELGLAKARDEGDRIRAGVDDRVAALRRQAQPHLSMAVDLVMDTVVAALEES